MAPTRPAPTGHTPTDLAWAAGFLDGEGCFRWAGSPSVQVTNTHLPSLRRLRAMFGGRVGGVKRASQRHRPTFRLCLSGDDAVACSRAVLPHLYEKRPQAALLLLASKYLRGTPGGSRMSHELRLMREAIGEALSALKRPTYELGARA